MEALVEIKKAKIPLTTAWNENSSSLYVDSFNAYCKEKVFIVGSSGQGKTTLLRTILSMHAFNSGVINFSEKASIRGMLAQQPQLVPWRTVRKNLELPAEINHKLLHPSDILEKLERLGLKGCENKFPHELSVGMRARVAFLQTLYSMPHLICLDEPSASLDDRSTILLMQELSIYLSSTGAAAIIASHDRDLVKNWASRTYRIEGDGFQNRLEIFH